MRKVLLIGLCGLLSVSVSGQHQKKKPITLDDKSTFQMASYGAKNGLPDMMCLLGIMYEEGRAVEKNYQTAMMWYLKASDNDYAEAHYRLGRLYENGWGVKKNDSKALKYYQKASDMGDENGFQSLMALQKKIDMARRMEATRNSTASAKENFDLAQTYYQQKDYDQAFPLFQLSADQGYGKAQYMMGLLYMEGKGVGSDYAVGAEWLQKAADQKVAHAQYMLGVLYQKGEGVTQDEKKGLSLIQTAAKQGDDDAKWYLEQARMNATRAAKKKAGPVAEEKNTYVVIIGNENYKNVASVPYAHNDASDFRGYVRNTLGIRDESHIRYMEDAGLNEVIIAVEWLVKSIQASGGTGKAIFYYAGHGIPNESDGSAFLLPVDGIGNMPRTAYSLTELYETLGKMQSPSVTVFLDACFSGSKREKGMLVAARGVAIKSKQSSPYGNMVVFTAAQGDETAYPYKERQHGLFTYYLLKKLEDSDGDVTYGELSEYLEKEVRRQSFANSGKMQTPATLVSNTLKNDWRTIKLK